jgi:AraC-like DNA-binding protein
VSDRRSVATLLRTEDLCVLDVRCTCRRGTVEEETAPGFEIVFPTSGLYRRNGAEVDATSAYVGRPGGEQHITHVTDGDRCVAVLLSERLASELGLDSCGSVSRSASQDRAVARARRTDEETWLRVLRPSRASPPRSVAADHERAVARVREALAAEPGLPWSLRSLAAVAGYAPHHLSRVFRACTGSTVSAHRDRVRLALAAELAGDGMPLADVATACGFVDHAHLTRRTRQVLGTVPSQLR